MVVPGRHAPVPARRWVMDCVRTIARGSGYLTAQRRDGPIESRGFVTRHPRAQLRTRLD